MMRTFTGRSVNLKTFSKDDIDLRDIAISLSRQRRYLGHTSVPWTVAQHCILGGMICAMIGVDSVKQRAFFLHDAHEAWFQDIISPIVVEYTTDAYKTDRAKADDVIYDFFGLTEVFAMQSTKDFVKKIDKVCWVMEEIDLRPGFNWSEARVAFDRDVTTLVDYLISENFKIPADLVNMPENQVAQHVLELLAVMHFEATAGGEIVVDEDDGA